MQKKSKPSAASPAPRRRAERRPERARAKGNAATQRLLRRLRARLRKLGQRHAALEAEQEDLAARLKKYADLYEAAPVGQLILDRQGTITEANRACARVLGVARSGLAGKRLGHYVLAPDRRILNGFLREVCKRRGVACCELRLRAPEKPPRDVHMTARMGASGRECCVVMVDVTERKRAEEAQRGHLAQIDTIYQDAPVGLCLLDPDLRYLRVNEALATLNGLPVEQHLGRTVREMVPHLADQTEAICRQVMTTGRPVLNVELTGRTAAQPDRTRTWVTFWSPVRLPDGHAIGINVIVQEITARKEAEEHFRNLSEHSPNMIFINQKGRVVYANHECSKVMGYSREEFLAPTFDFLSLIAPESLRQVHNSFRQHLAGQETPSYECTLLGKAGRRINAIITTKLIDYEGETAILGIVTDISRRKTAEDALREAYDTLERRVAERTGELAAANAALRVGEARLRMALDAADMVAWEWDLTTDRIHYTDNLPSIARGEKTAAYCSVATLAQQLHPDDQEPFARAVERTHTKGCPFECEYRVRMLDGKYHWIHGQGKSLVVTEGKPSRVLGISQDITARKQAETQLRLQRDLAGFLSETRDLGVALDRLLDAALQIPGVDCGGVYLHDPETRGFALQAHRKLSPRFVQAAGFFPENSAGAQRLQEGQPLYTLPPDVSGNLDKTLQAEGILGLAVVPLIHEGRPLGSFNFGSRAFPEIPASSRPAIEALAALVVGAIARMQARQAEHETAERLKLAQSSAHVGIWDWDLRSGKVTWTPELERLYGYAEGTFPGSYEAFLERVHPDDRVEMQRQRDEAVRAHRTFDFDFRLKPSPTETRWVNCKGSALYDETGNPRRLLGVNVDITERKRTEAALRDSEEQLRSFLRNSAVVGWMKDDQGRYEFLSDNLQKRFQVRAEDWQGRTDFELWPRDVAEALHRNDQAALRGGEAVERIENLPNPDGSPSWWLTSKFPFRDASGNSHTGGLGVEITALKQAEAELRRLNEGLERRVQERTAELQSLSRRLLEVQESERRALALELHDEIGQSLTSLRLAMDTGAVDLARAAANELMARVRDLSLDLRPSMLDDLGLLPALVWQFERYTTRSGIQVRFHHQGLEGRRFAPALETAAYRIAQEALTNVARHASVREVTVHAVATAETVRLQVQDSGRGFDLAAALEAGRSSGLRGMIERASLLRGRLVINADTGAGTFLLAELPIEPEPPVA